MKRGGAYKVALTGMLFALAIALSYFESLITPFFGLPPGVKLGLSNIVVVYALLFLTKKQAWFLVLLKAGMGFLTRGGLAGMLSLAGGLLSLFVMMVLLLPKIQASLLLLSVFGAISHNIGQLFVFSLWYGSFAWAYAPILILAGVAMGLVTALTLRVLLPALEKAGLAITPDKQK